MRVCRCPQVIEKVRREQDTYNVTVKGLEAAQKAASADYERLVLSEREIRHAKELAKQVWMDCKMWQQGGIWTGFSKLET